ncbi:MAG: hypothetical protein N3A58_00290 [Spirochaetes bacterium]|nr:hypothetical protein [Spirochaetota bacterium]
MKIINFLLLVILFLFSFFISYKIINLKKEIFEIDSKINRLKEENENLKMIKEKMLSKIRINENLRDENLIEVEKDDILILEKRN